MGYYDIDIDSLATKMLPVRWRKVRQLAWLKVLVNPITYVYNLFVSNRASNIYNLSHNSQVCYLQAALNDVFDPVERGIYISDGPDNDQAYIYLNAEEQPIWLYIQDENMPVVTYTNIEMAYQGPCFVVKVPSGLVYDNIRMKAVIDKYRLVSKYYYEIGTY